MFAPLNDSVQIPAITATVHLTGLYIPNGIANKCAVFIIDRTVVYARGPVCLMAGNGRHHRFADPTPDQLQRFPNTGDFTTSTFQSKKS
jgi:hypothetical protein